MASRTITPCVHLPGSLRRRLWRHRAETLDKVELRRRQMVLQWAAGQTPEQIAQDQRLCIIRHLATNAPGQAGLDTGVNLPSNQEHPAAGS